MTSIRRMMIAAICALTTVAALVPLATPAQATPDFYALPTGYDGVSAGQVIRTQPFRLMSLVPTASGSLPRTATRIMYRSTDSNGRPNAVTGTYIEPTTRWRGVGSRPIVAFAPGTHGQGDQCAPSKLLGTPFSYTPPADIGFEYEISTLTGLLDQGYAVVETDYEGLGTAIPHTYVNRLSEAHAVLDSVRAARQLTGTSIDSRSPVALWGYSQGGGASAAAVELAPRYAPELPIKAAFVGAPPADLKKTLEGIDGTGLTGAIGYTINGLAYSDPGLRPIIDANTNAAGRRALARLSQQCTFETTLEFGFHRTSEWTTSGRPLSQVLDGIPVAGKILAANRIGTLRPSAPVYVYSNVTDDTVAHGQVLTLARDWCAKGATVDLVVDNYPAVLPGSGLGHIVPDLVEPERAGRWLAGQLRGDPAINTCGRR